MASKIEVVEAGSKTADVGRYELVSKETADVGRFEVTADVVAFVGRFGVNLAQTVEGRADDAAKFVNQSQLAMLCAGVLLLSIKDECQHGGFAEIVEARGFGERAARKAMQYARFVFSRPEEDRERLLTIPKSKVMLLASADQEVVDAVMSGDLSDMKRLSVRALELRIKDLEAATTDLTVQRDRAEAEADSARKRLERGPRTDGLPLVIADVRGEIGALTKKADLCIESMTAVGQDLAMLIGTDGASAWVDGTARMGLAALAGLRLQIDGQIDRWKGLLPEGEASVLPDGTSYMTQEEVRELAQSWAQITAVHSHEKALREWEAEQNSARGKGRPRAKPEAPKV